jgi:hypothetical protein
MKFMLLKNKGEKYFQTETYNLSDYVNSLGKFLSISAEDFMKKIDFPKAIKYIPECISKNPYDVFEINPEDSHTIDEVKIAFSNNFRRLVHENNHSMPIRYRIMDMLFEGYSERKIDDLATLRFWPI